MPILLCVLAVGAFLLFHNQAQVENVSFIARIWDKINKVLPKELSPLAKSLVLAHAAYESGLGTAKPYVNGRNLFNISAGSGWLSRQGPTTASTDSEYDKATGKFVRYINQTWRAYASEEDSLIDYWDFLGPNQNSGRYVKARERLVAGDPTGFVHELSKAGFFTLPENQYLAGLGAKYDEVTRALT